MSVRSSPLFHIYTVEFIVIVIVRNCELVWAPGTKVYTLIKTFPSLMTLYRDAIPLQKTFPTINSIQIFTSDEFILSFFFSPVSTSLSLSFISMTSDPLSTRSVQDSH